MIGKDLIMARLKYLDEHGGFDYVLEMYDSVDFTEFVISMGGDVMRCRVYGSTDNDFVVYEK